MKTDQFSSMNDVIFEKRNKRYGAYELRMNYHRRLFKSFVVASVSLVSVFLVSRFTRTVAHTDLTDPMTDTLLFSAPFTVEQPSTPKTPETFSPPPAPVQPLDPNAFVEVSDTTTETVDTSSHMASATSANTDAGSGLLSSGGISDTTNRTGGLPEVPFVHNTSNVDKVPEFPGGLDKFYAFLLSRIRYTGLAQENGVKGRMYAKFVVDENGLICNVSIVKSLGFGLDEQVSRALQQSPKWSPGIARNSAVKTELILPVNFNLQ